MPITSIMRENIGTSKSLGTITLEGNEGGRAIFRKGASFIQRNLKKRDKPVTQGEIRETLGYLFDIDGSKLEFNSGLDGEEDAVRAYVSSLVNKDDSKDDDLAKQYRFMSSDIDAKSGYKAEDVKWTQFYSDHRGEDEPTLVTVFIGKPKQFKSNRNGAILSYRSIKGLTFQINLDRLMAIGILIKMFKDTGVIGEDPNIDKFIRQIAHDTLPQSKALVKKSWGYSIGSIREYGRDEYFRDSGIASKKIAEGFKRAYRMELNIKSMEDYEKNLGKTVATAFETKKNIPPKILQAMQKSKFLKKGFKFVELDEDTDLEKYKIVENYYLDIHDRLPDLQIQALRFRKLGKHSVGGNPVSGLYSPSHRSIAVDLRQFDSFIHEYAHAIDYMTEKGEIQSMQYGFTDILNKYEQLLPKDVGERGYYLTPTEVFARGFEVAFREKYPTLDTGLMKTPEKLRRSKAHYPFYADKELFEEVVEYMKDYIG